MANKNPGSAKQPTRSRRKKLNALLGAAGYTAGDPEYKIAHTLLDGWSLTTAELMDAAERLAIQPPKAA